MGKEILQLTALLRKRLHALESLSSEIAAGQDACVALDLDGVQAHDRRKEDLCAEIRRIELEIAALRQDPTYQGLFRASVDPVSNLPLSQADKKTLYRLWEESEAARLEVGRRNQVYAEFLRRAHSTVGVMMNVISHCLGVYPSEMFPAQTFFERSV
ncbi:MAG TPA: hypothetical protein VGX94_11430 [Terriglobia bacterium]|nr:hypothetical protein [Terriglobia bacterium]